MEHKYMTFKKVAGFLSEAAYKKASKLVSKAKIYAPAFLLLTATPMAHALRVSDLTTGQATEISAVLKLFLLGTAALGIGFAGISVISWIVAIKRQEPAKWQLYGAVGGAAAVVVPLLVLAMAGSLTSEQGNADSVFSELQINR